MSVSRFNSVIPRAQSFIIVISASDHLPLRTIVVFGVTLRLLVIHFVVVSRQKQTPSLTSDYIVLSTRWSVTAKYIALRFHSTPWSQVLAQNRDFCLYHLHSTPSLGGSRRNIAMTFSREKLEWCGYPTVKKFRRYLYSFWQNVRKWRTDRRTPHDGKAALDASIARQKPTNCAGAQVKLVWIQGQL